jgi:hypothetical protein
MTRKPHKTMTPDEYAALQIEGWHEVCRNVDGFGGVGVRFVTAAKKSGEIDDDWPEDYLEQFWKQFPPFRRQARAKVGQKLAKIRAAGAVTWQVLFAGVLKFAATNPGEYAPAPMVWLNDGRWDREYGKGFSNGKTQGASGDKIGFSGLAARIRYGDLDGESRPAPEDLEPVNRR